MSKPLTDDERETIATMLRGGSSRGEIRKATSRSAGAIQNVADAIGHKADQSSALRTRNARAARSSYSEEARAKLAARLTDEANFLLDQMHGEYLAYNFGGKDNTYAEHILPKPPVEAQRHLMAAARDAMRTVLDIHRADQRAEESPIAAMVIGLVSSLREGDKGSEDG